MDNIINCYMVLQLGPFSSYQLNLNQVKSTCYVKAGLHLHYDTETIIQMW